MAGKYTDKHILSKPTTGNVVASQIAIMCLLSEYHHSVAVFQGLKISVKL